MGEFLILGEVRKGNSKTTALDVWREDFGLFGRLIERVPWKAVLKGKEIQEGWAFFKKEVLNVQEQGLPMCQKTSWWGRRLDWLNKGFWLEPRIKNRVYKLWKMGQATQKDYKGVGRLCRKSERQNPY